jgi:hypothetical protein
MKQGQQVTEVGVSSFPWNNTQEEARLDVRASSFVGGQSTMTRIDTGSAVVYEHSAEREFPCSSETD